MVEKKRGEMIILFIGILILLIIPLISAGFFSDTWNKITGRATTGLTNVSVTLSGTNAVTIRVWNESLTGVTVDPTEYSVGTNGANDVPFTVTVNDIDGVTDIVDTSVYASFNTSNARRTNTTACAKITGDANTTSQNYTCTIRMFYFDNNETWTIVVNATDYGTSTVVSNGTMEFEYGFLKAFIITPNLVTWPTLSAGLTNRTSNQNTTLNNTGNVPINSLNIKVNAVDLQGKTTTTKYLNVSNFSSSWDSTSPNMCGNLSNGILLVNNTDVSLPTANLTRGNVSAANTTTLGQEILYYCIQRVPAIQSQVYASNDSGAWTLKIQ